jgi:nitroreductase
MNLDAFDQIEAVIKNRRTVKAHAMNGGRIPDHQVQKLLELADRAPTHGQTEPWRYFIFADDALDTFGRKHADLYWKFTDEKKRRRSKYNKYINYANNASHLLISVLRPGGNPNIPKKEERSAVSAANQNILLGATALGISSYWSTGGMTYHPELKKYLKLDVEDEVIGMIYLGYTDVPPREKKRKIPLKEKVTWVKKQWRCD